MNILLWIGSGILIGIVGVTLMGVLVSQIAYLLIAIDDRDWAEVAKFAATMGILIGLLFIIAGFIWVFVMLCW
ncbi:MAG TPA: hypothetical protein VNA25_30675 [Phycisphaerae bacterium]|nr:hypothetical protein [Phycisphaerae bacterium]